jgi:RHS repeat-associated protein
LTVQHFSGPLTEETGYYPFGLAMSGISSKAALKLENRHKYNGIEEEKALGLNVYDAQFRELDPQTGRWWQIDPKTDEMLMWSTYASNYDNPIRYQDHYGDKPGGTECCGDIRDMVDNDRVMQGQMSLEEKMQRTRQRATVGTVGVALVASVLIPGPDEVLLAGALSRAGAFLRSYKAVDKAVDAVQDAKKAEQVVDKAAQLKKAEDRVAKLSRKPRNGKDFTKSGKDAVKDLNKVKNDGKMKCEDCGQGVANAEKHQRGQTPSHNEAHVDHVIPKAKNGSGTPNNGQVLCRGCNLEKGAN